MFINKIVTFVFLMITKPRVLYYYAILLRNEHVSFHEIKVKQDAAILRILKSAQKNSQFYRNHIDVKKLENELPLKILDNMPVITKQEIIKRGDDFNNMEMPLNSWKPGRTGGSTGTPFRYRLSKKCNDMAFAILFRGWGRGGYRLGDKLAVLAGGSLVEKNINFRGRIISFALNQRKYSSYGVDEVLFRKYYENMLAWQPRFLQGYVSAIYEYARFLEKYALTLKVKAIFTTAEMLLKHEKNYIEKVFGCKVFNTYGLNDGGVAAFECEKGEMHIDMERSYLEVVNEEEKAVIDQPGRIVATALLNEATFFIRYDTGDIGAISGKRCKCGSPYPILSKLEGRKTDALEINKKIIGSPVLTVLMSSMPVNRYQFVQSGKSLTVILDVEGTSFKEEHEEIIRKSIYSQVGEFNLIFKYGVNSFELTENSKHRVIVKK